jgi:hypothetical protein
MPVSVSASAVGAVLSFLVVAASTYVVTSVLSAGSSLVYSLITAAVTSIVWFGVTYSVSGTLGVAGFWVALGPVLAVLAYVLVVDLLYEGGLGQAIGSPWAPGPSRSSSPTWRRGSATVRSKRSASRRGSDRGV